MDQAQAQAIEQTTLTTAEQLLPVLLAAISSGAAATTPQGAVIAMVAQVIPPLLQSFSANSSQVEQLMTALVTQINANQATFDATAKARGLDIPSLATSQAA